MDRDCSYHVHSTLLGVEPPTDLSMVQQKYFILNNLINVLKNSPDDPTIRRIYLSLLMFFDENKDSYLTYLTYTAWLGYIQNPTLSTPHEVMNTLESMKFLLF